MASILDYGVPSTTDRSEQIQEIVEWAMGQINKDRTSYNFIGETLRRRFPEFEGLFSKTDRIEVMERISDYFWN